MDPLRCQCLQQESGTLPAEQVLRIYDQIARACRHAGLRSPDAEDVAQDVWEWLLRTNNLALAQQIPWVGAVAQNFIRRFWRRSHRRSQREGASLVSAMEPRSREPALGLEGKEVLDRISTALPDRERKLLTLIRCGYTLAEAARVLRIPRGSRAYHGGRLIEYARREIRRSAPSVRGHSPSCG
jgi:DNA-directed RNA polymerase specialized sigma24 family protein